MSFEKKIHIFAQNPKVLAFGFTENCQFGAKTDRNSVFPGRDPRNANWLSITVPHFNFYGFWKISHFCSKPMGVSQRFYRKLPVWGKNWPKLRISWSLPPILWIGYPSWSRIWIFTGFEKFHIFARNAWVLAYGFTKNRQFGAKMDRNSVFLGREPRIADRLSITASYMYFYGFWQISHFRSKCISVGLRFYRKSPVSVKNCLKLRIS